MVDTTNLSGTALVAGGNGFIGRAVVQSLICEGLEVFSVGKENPPTKNRLPDVHYISCDISDWESVSNRLSDISVNYVINAAGSIDHSGHRSDRAIQVLNAHFQGCLNLARVFQFSSLKRFVQIGSSDEYTPFEGPISESFREQPSKPYSLAKAMSSILIQSLARDYGFPGIIVRPFLVFGPGQKLDRLVPQVTTRLLEGKPLDIKSPSAVRDFCYITDFIESIKLILARDISPGEIINIASGNPTTVGYIVDQICKKITGRSFDFTCDPSSVSNTLYADITKAKQVLGWQPKTELLSALDETICYYKNHT